MENPNYVRKENEDMLDYAMRLISIKKELKPRDLDWCDIVDYLGLDYNPDSLRKSQDSQFGGLAVYNEMRKRMTQNAEPQLQTKLANEMHELQKLKYAISDERAALNKQLKEQSRIDSLKDIALACVNKMEPLEARPIYDKRPYTDASLVVALSDFHYGLEIDEFNNKYNPGIFHRRLEILLNRCIEQLCTNDRIGNVIVLGIGDFIAGLIHNINRIESRENVIEQIIAVSEALSDFLYKLSTYCHVDYYDCIGNHSRLFEDKNNCLSKESFDLLIHYILKLRFYNEELIDVHEYTINEKIGTFSAYGKQYAFVHGDNFNIETLAKDLSLLTKTFFEGIFIGHIHHIYIEEQNGTMVISNGSFAGNDEYSNKLRKTSMPSQNLFLISSSGIEMIQPIKLGE